MRAKLYAFKAFPADRAAVAAVVASIRWAAVALALLEVLLTATPPPLSVPVAVLVTVAMAAYNIPLTFARRLPDRMLEPLISGGVVGDFLVCSAWVALSLNDAYDAPWAVYILVAIEASVLYGWAGGFSFMLAFTAVYSVLDWIQSQYFGPPFRLDSYVYRVGLVVLVGIFTTALGAEGQRRQFSVRQAAEDAARHAERSDALYRVASRIAASLKREDVLAAVMDSLGSLHPERWHGILLFNPEGELRLERARGIPAEVDFPLPAPRVLALIEEEALVVSNVDADARLPREALAPGLERYVSAAVLPLRVPNRQIGLLVALDRRPGAFKDDEARFLAALAHQASTALENARLYEEVELMSFTDATTSLFNRRAFDLRLREELARARRYRLPLALLMLDVDHFKLYNDRYGHPAGDRLLRRLGEVLVRDVLRHSDLPFRFGGEEFAVIMPHTKAQEALTLARRICDEVHEENIQHSENLPYGRFTVSIGVAAFPEDGLTAGDLVYHADVALYAAKRGGRNRVVLFSRPVVREGGQREEEEEEEEEEEQAQAQS